MFKSEEYVKRLSVDNVAVYLLHGVIKSCNETTRNYNRKHILENDFYGLMKSLKQYGHPLTMTECVECLKNKNAFPKKSFVITFDDGFENNYSVAAPILENLKIPSIIYITTKFLDNNLMSWVDQIDYAIDATVKKSIKLSFFKNEISILTYLEKITFLKNIRIFAKETKEFFENKEKYIKEIFAACDVHYTVSNNSEIDLKMNWNQLRSLSSSPFFEIGGHTHTHPIMSFLSEDECEKEVDVCLDRLQTETNTKTQHFSYPEGLANCYNDKIISYLRSKDIICSPTAIDGVNDINSHPFHLKRITVV